MPRTASQRRRPLGWALLLALSLAALPAARAHAADATAEAAEAAKPQPEVRGEAQSFVDARDGYAQAQRLFKDREYAHALAVLDEAISTLNWVITHAQDRRLRTSSGDLLRRTASLRLSCTRAMEKERAQLVMVGPPAPHRVEISRPSDRVEIGRPSGSDTTEVAGADSSVLEAAKPQPALEIKTLPAPEIPSESNPRVQKWIDFYTGRGRGTFEMWLTRSGLYMEWMKTILRGEGLPTDLVHLVFVESGFNPHALSRSRAAGPWQFIRGTAKIFGLQVNSWVDERKDPERATLAAARYLKHLYSVFDSWPLALAGYNAGEGTVVRAIARQGTKDFWSLSLPRETRDYVPKYLACLSIARHPEQYGFAEVPRAPALAFETVRIPGPVDLNAIAVACNTSQEEMRRLNPMFLRYAAPNDGSGMVTLRVPDGSADKLLAGLGDGTLSLPTVQTPPDPKYLRHKVKRGETLAKIARRYGVTVGELARANRLRTKSRVHRGQTLRVPNGDVAYVAPSSSGSASVKASKSKSSGGSAGAIYAGTRSVRIKPGDTLSVIAERHNTSVRTLRALNNLRPREQIRAGATIKVPRQG